MQDRNWPIDRRQFVAGVGAATLGGCVNCPELLTGAWSAGTGELGDVHAHFFNMSDLPMEGFLRHVLIPNRAPGLADVADALVDIAGWLKRRSPTVREEGGRLRLALGALPERDVGAARFSRMLADRINAGAAAASPPGAGAAADASPSLASSYAALARLINRAASAGAVGTAADGALARVMPEQIEAILDEDVPAGAADASALADDNDPCAVVQAACAEEACEEPEPAPLPLQADRILTAIRWLWDMMQGRCSHVRRYFALTRGGGNGQPRWRPRLAVHHLVDYDRWLDDGPSPGSTHEAQIDFWSDFSRRRRDELEIVTFGGYDPLKHAEQRLLNEPLFFKHLSDCYDAGVAGGQGPAIGGFKLYPPMGFKPRGNRAADYEGKERARAIVSDRWRVTPGLAGQDIGLEIDRSLGQFYEFCIDRDAPILSHSIPGNQAACCFGQRANPDHWADLIEAVPRYGKLRLCLGHGISEAECFVTAVEGLLASPSRPAPRHVWALHGTRRLLQMSALGRANVYADIGYLSEWLKPDTDDGARFAARFFAALKWYCEQYDPGCRRILFGTDWIMVGQELGYSRYVNLALYGMAQAGWPSEWQHNLLHANLRAFLKSGGASPQPPSTSAR